MRVLFSSAIHRGFAKTFEHTFSDRKGIQKPFQHLGLSELLKDIVGDVRRAWSSGVGI